MYDIIIGLLVNLQANTIINWYQYACDVYKLTGSNNTFNSLFCLHKSAACTSY